MFKPTFAATLLGGALLCPPCAAQNAPLAAPNLAALRPNASTFTTQNFEITPFNMSATTIDGAPAYAAQSEQSGARGIWIRLKDAAFQNGAAPVVDVEFQVQKTATGRFWTLADTARGPQVVQDERGLRKWTTIRVPINDARFGGGLEGGADLIISAEGGGFAVRDFKIVGHDVSKNPDFSRLVSLDSIETNVPENLLLFRRGEAGEVRYNWRNLARIDASLEWRALVTDWNGKPVWSQTQAWRFGAGSSGAISVPVNTKNWLLGAYSLNLTLVQKTSGGEKKLFERESYLGLASPGTLRKAKEGEFLFGLDAWLGSAHRNPRLMEWMKIMGVDVVRGGFFNPRDMEGLERGLEIYGKAGIQPILMPHPPAGDDLEALKPRIAEEAKWIAGIAKRFPQIRFYELGNEPDLLGFYRGPIENYAYGMNVMAKAIKEANPNAYVMNGGLCFAGDEGRTRARRFLEVVDTTHLDAIAYHAHGPFVMAERNLFDLTRRTASEFGKGHLPLVETESGVSARTRPQDENQARTLLQKSTFGQSQGMPFFVWFRLLMFEESYGNLRTDQEPKPVVLAYRNMVERLRGQNFSRLLGSDDKTKNGVETYLFASKDGRDSTAVVFSNAPGARVVEFEAKTKTGQIPTPRAFDLYGNPAPLRRTATGAWSVEATNSAQFVVWQGADVASIRRAIPVVQSAPQVQILENRANLVQARIRNPFSRPLNAQVALETQVGGAQTGAKNAASGRKTVALKANETRVVEFEISPPARNATIEMPRAWTVFHNVDAAQIDWPQLSRNDAPASLPATGGKVTSAKRGFLRGTTLDLATLGAVPSDRAVALLFADIESPHDQTITVGATADWRMEWRVNGEAIYSTIERGNNTMTGLTDHVLEMPLKRGRNRVALQLLSGGNRWKIHMGGPREVTALRNPGQSDQLIWKVSEGAQTLATQGVPIEWAAPLPALGTARADSALAVWQERAPTIFLGSESIDSDWIKTPQSQNWTRGDADLSANLWLAQSPSQIVMLVQVSDDIHKNAANRATLAGSDSVQIAFSRGGKSYDGFLIGRENGAVKIIKMAREGGAALGEIAPGGEANAQIERDETAKTTLYRITFDTQKLGLQGRDFWINAQITDNDGGLGPNGSFAKQRLAWRGLLNLENRERDAKPLEWNRTRVGQ